jgi:hypothetical protein
VCIEVAVYHAGNVFTVTLNGFVQWSNKIFLLRNKKKRTFALILFNISFAKHKNVTEKLKFLYEQ